MQTFPRQTVHKELFMCSFGWDFILYENHNCKIYLETRVAFFSIKKDSGK